MPAAPTYDLAALTAVADYLRWYARRRYANKHMPFTAEQAEQAALWLTDIPQRFPGLLQGETNDGDDDEKHDA